MRKHVAPGRDDAGAASVLVLAMAGVLCFATLGLVAATGLVVAQRQAQGVVDLAALAAARTLTEGGDGCAAAARMADAGGATVITCTVTGPEVRLELEVPGPRWSGRWVQVGAQARAGPGG